MQHPTTTELRSFRLCLLAICLALLSISGCATRPVTVTAPASATVLAPAAAQMDAAKKAADEAAKTLAARDSKLAASSEVIRRQNEAAPISPQKPVIAAEVGLMQRTLAVTPSAADRAAAAERETLMLSGKLSEASRFYADASAKADAANAQIAAANAQRDAAFERVKEEISNAATKLAAQQTKHDADMATLEAKHKRDLEAERSQVLLAQVAWFNRIGAGCEALAIAAIGLGFFFGGLATLQKLGPVAAFLGVAGLLCFGLAQIIGQPWFKWACLGSVAVIVAWAGVFIYRHYKAGDLKQEAETRLGKVTATLGAVVPVLDDAYDNADATVKDLLDKTIFSRLKDLMTNIPGANATIHEVRATAAATVQPPTNPTP